MGKKISIAILGPIGAGKTTLLRALETEYKKNFKNVIVKAEPSVTIPFITDLLQKFYADNKHWSYPLQLCISAAQETMFQDLRLSDFDIALFDMPYSSDIYSYSHMKHGRMTGDEHRALVEIGSDYPFDVVIILDEQSDIIKAHVKVRNEAIRQEKLDNGQDDVEIEDISYLDEHIADFKEYQTVWLARFMSANPNLKTIIIPELPDIADPEYTNIVELLGEELPKIAKDEGSLNLSVILDSKLKEENINADKTE